jgi:hypothetical protein
MIIASVQVSAFRSCMITARGSPLAVIMHVVNVPGPEHAGTDGGFGAAGARVG